MLLLVLSLSVAADLVTAPAAAPGAVTWREHLAAGEHAYDEYDFAGAIERLLVVLGDPELKDGASRQRARLLLAFSLRLANPDHDVPQAAAELQRLFAENVDYELDRGATPPELVHFFDSERAKFVASMNEVPAEARTTGDKHPWTRIFPGGIGHFLNHDYAAGGAFLGLELALVATNVAVGVVWWRLRQADGFFFNDTNPMPLQVVMNVAAFAAIGLAVIEIIDAFVWSPARGRKALAKTLHPEVKLGALGAFRFSFGM